MTVPEPEVVDDFRDRVSSIGLIENTQVKLGFLLLQRGSMTTLGHFDGHFGTTYSVEAFPNFSERATTEFLFSDVPTCDLCTYLNDVAGDVPA